MNLKEAKNIAILICEKLQPYCEKINIAGSIRRKKPDVKDIEVVALPKTEIIKIDLFENHKEVRSQDFINIISRLKIIKGNAQGKMMQIELPENIMLDLFMPDDFDYYRQYAIRTGSALYSQKVIATGWVKNGWCGSDKGLRKQDDCERKIVDGKNKWKCVNSNAKSPPVWNSEKEFFEWIKVKYVEPEKRSI